MNGASAEDQGHLEERLAAECRALLAMLWIGYTRAEAEEALQAEHHDVAGHLAQQRRATHKRRG